MSFNYPDTHFLLNQTQHDRLLEEARWQQMLRPCSSSTGWKLAVSDR